MSDALAPYSHFPGNPVAKPPCKMRNANMYGFFLKGDAKRIQSYLNNTLNTLATETVRFTVLSDFVLLTFTDIERIASVHPPFDEHGWMQETDIIVWLPVAKMVKSGKSETLVHIYWYPAFICVNNVYALINGRETWGYNKYLCQCEMPALGEDAIHFSVSVDTFAHYGGDSQLKPSRLLDVMRITKAEESLLEYGFELAHEVAALLASEKGPGAIDLAVIKQLLRGFIHPQMDQILFKQFPDGGAERAVYQAVVHSPSKIKKLHHLKLLRHDYEVTLHANASFPLASMFGIQNGPQAAWLPFNVLMDFEQLGAFEVAMEGSNE